MSELPITQINIPHGIIDLGKGNPDLDLLPLDLIQQATDKHFSTGDRRFLQYGVEQGDGYFRQDLADFLSRTYGNHLDPTSLFVTAGASSALDLLCSLYTQPADVVLVEEPSYFLALQIFENHRLHVVSIAKDDHGLRLDVLEEKLNTLQPKFIYTIPTFQNPSGRTLSQTRREKLIALSQQYNFMIVADEVYHFLHYSQTPPMAFAEFAEQVEQVISVNSFSNILATGLRLGWMDSHLLLSPERWLH